MPRKLSRRSFIKTSVVGVVAATNVTLINGLISATLSSEGTGHLHYEDWSFLAFQTGYPTQAAAQAAAAGVNRSYTNPQWVVVSHYVNDENCVDVSPPRQEPDPEIFTINTYQRLDGLWTYTMTSHFTVTFAEDPNE